jgi:hypothetical protein
MSLQRAKQRRPMMFNLRCCRQRAAYPRESRYFIMAEHDPAAAESPAAR